MRVFPDPRSESEWGDSIVFWEELLRPTADSFGWKWPWFTRQPDDGAKYFSAWNPNVGRSFTLHQVGPDTTVFDPFYDTFGEERAGIAYLVTRTCAPVSEQGTQGYDLNTFYSGELLQADDAPFFVVPVPY